MTPIPLSKYRAMPEREKDALLAEHVIGRKVVEAGGKFYMAEKGEVPAFTRNLNACAEMEQVIKKGDKRIQYIHYLLEICVYGNLGTKPLGDYSNPAKFFALAHATAAQKCEAALLAMGAVVEDAV